MPTKVACARPLIVLELLWQLDVFVWRGGRVDNKTLQKRSAARS